MSYTIETEYVCNNNEKRVLKKSKEGYMEKFGGRNGRGKIM